ncbi:MAG: hypothetical protein ACNA8W_02975 [Bradymonadaceae bacterium]
MDGFDEPPPWSGELATPNDFWITDGTIDTMAASAARIRPDGTVDPGWDAGLDYDPRADGVVSAMTVDAGTSGK